MAIVPDIPGLKVEVFVNDSPTKEYEDPDLMPAKTVSRYIEVQSETNFEIVYGFKAPFPRNRTVSMKVTVDGRELDEPVVLPRDMFGKKLHTSAGPISKNGLVHHVQKFCFSDLDTKEGFEEEITEELKESLDLVGTITLSFYFLENPRNNKGFRVPRKIVDEMDTVPEKALKGEALTPVEVRIDCIAQCLRPAERTIECDIIDADYADCEPFATVHFHYRSLAALKSLGIVPRTREDMAGLDLENLNNEQLRRLVRDMRLRAEANLHIKREREEPSLLIDDDEDDVVFMKRRKKFPLRLPTRRDTVIVLD